MKILQRFFKMKKEFPKRYKLYHRNYQIGYTQKFDSITHAEDVLRSQFKFVIFNHEKNICVICYP